MRVAVVGGTGTVGRHVVQSLQSAGHEPVVVTRSNGADIVTGNGLDAALAGADGVIDVSNRRAPELAGPEEHELVDLVRRLVKARRQRLLLVPVRLPGTAGRAMAGGALLPEAPGQLGERTFDQWLAGEATRTPG